MKRSYFKPEILSRSSSKEEEGRRGKEIHIPEIEEMFKNQYQEYMLYESRMMRNQLTKAMNQIDNGVARIKSYSIGEMGGGNGNDTRKSTGEKFPNVHGGSRSITHSSHLNE
jgi:hypothetical protein